MYDSLAIGTQDGNVTQIDAFTGETRWCGEGHSRPVQCVAISPDGRSVASASADRSWIIWDAPKGKARVVNRGHSADTANMCICKKVRDQWGIQVVVDETCPVIGHSRTIQAAAFSPCGRKLATGGEDRSLVQWSVETGEELMRIEYGHFIFDIEYSRDGTLLASGGRNSSVVIWNAHTGTLIRTLRYSHSSSLWSISFSPDCTHLASSGADQHVRIWEVDSGRQVMALAGHQVSKPHTPHLKTPNPGP